MANTKRSTIYFDADLHRALRLKAAETDQSVSDLVNEAVRILLSEDASDLAIAKERAAEPAISYESFVKDLQKRGKLQG